LNHEGAKSTKKEKETDDSCLNPDRLFMLFASFNRRY
jgi:hypothetical protein